MTNMGFARYDDGDGTSDGVPGLGCKTTARSAPKTKKDDVGGGPVVGGGSKNVEAI
jgi:hypothetical protein